MVSPCEKDFSEKNICSTLFNGVFFKLHMSLLQSLNGHQGTSKDKYFDQNCHSAQKLLTIQIFLTLKLSQ